MLVGDGRLAAACGRPARAHLANRGHQPDPGLTRLLRRARGSDSASLADHAMMRPLIPVFYLCQGVGYERWWAGSSAPSS
jgi:hypothetical protein